MFGHRPATDTQNAHKQIARTRCHSSSQRAMLARIHARRVVWPSLAHWIMLIIVMTGFTAISSRAAHVVASACSRPPLEIQRAREAGRRGSLRWIGASCLAISILVAEYLCNPIDYCSGSSVEFVLLWRVSNRRRRMHWVRGLDVGQRRRRNNPAKALFLVASLLHLCRRPSWRVGFVSPATCKINITSEHVV